MDNCIAIIFVDGDEFIRCQQGDNPVALFRETVAREGGDVALMEWKHRYGVYIKTRESFSARVKSA